ncbi:hypothetical protein [Pseudomonas sp. Irchel 3A5]|uniref:hypothetical protein n=1 Tax=Pseudomonas sp. Irchel 3A5 TaxID=2008911 RepID=UPI000BA3E3CE|nr:hypothetical protein [Pseudomonas sp. Irchel 3A5]
MIMRLEMVEKGLVEKLKLVSEEQRRIAVKVACELAFQASPVEVPIVVESLRQLLSGNRLTTDQVSGLDALAAQLDEKYFDLQDSLEEGQNLNLEGLQLFSQARAVSALSLAGRENSLITATEAIYEASSAVDDGAHIFKAVLSVLPES